MNESSKPVYDAINMHVTLDKVEDITQRFGPNLISNRVISFLRFRTRFPPISAPLTVLTRQFPLATKEHLLTSCTTIHFCPFL